MNEFTRRTKSLTNCAFLNVCLLFAPSIVQGASLHLVQSGTATIANASTSTTATITAVDTTKSFLVFSTSPDSNEPQNGQITGQITNSTTLTFARWGNTGAVAVRWYVAEFTSGVSVQRGGANQSATTVNVTISAVNTAKAFPLISLRTQGVNFSANDFPKAKLTSGTNLELTVNTFDNSGTMEWQVIEYSDATVQSGDLSFGTGDSSLTATISSVNTSKCWLVYTHKTDDGTIADIGGKLVRGTITNATTLTFDRDNTGQALDLTWYAIEFTDGTTVQKDSQSFTSGETQKNITITNVDTTWAIAAGGSACRGGKTAYSADDNPGTGWFTLALTSATNLRITRSLTGSATADAGWFVIQFVANATNISMVSLAARNLDNGVLVEWRTEYEADNLGFDVFREEQDGRLLRLTRSPIAGSALLAAPGTALSAGRSYSFPDQDPGKKGLPRYWIEETDIHGQHAWHGPVTPTKAPTLNAPFRQRSALLNGLGTPASEVARSCPARPPHCVEPHGEKSTGLPWKLASLPAVKISVASDGWQRVGQGELLAAGLPPDADPRHLRLFSDQGEVPLRVSGSLDDRLGPKGQLEFYGSGLDTPFSGARVYWLIEGDLPGRRIRVERCRSVAWSPESFALTSEWRERSVYFAALRNGDRENFFGRVIRGEPVEVNLTLHHLAPAPPESAVLEVTLQGVTQAPHRVAASFNGRPVGEVAFEGLASATARMAIPHDLLLDGENILALTPQGVELNVSLLESIRLTYHHTYTADHDLLECTVPHKSRVTLRGFTSPKLQVLDITRPDEPILLRGRVRPDDHGFAITVDVARAAKLLALGESGVQHPLEISRNVPSHWAAAQQGADLVMVSHRSFIPALAPLQAVREAEGLRVAIIDVEDLYDEFNFGAKSPAAIKAFLRRAREVWTTPPTFLLLVGDASFDPRDYLGLGNFDLVPTKLVDTTVLETASDDWFADFDDDSLPEMAVGRIPVRTPEEAGAVVAKIVEYSRLSPGAPWTKNALLVSDRSDSFDFEGATMDLGLLLSDSLLVRQALRSRGDDLATRDIILSSFEAGQSVVNYLGHGSVETCRGSLFTSADAHALQNRPRLPFVVIMDCLNGFFHDLYTECLAEALLKAPEGGAIAVWAASGLTAPTEQAAMNQELFRLLFGGGPSLTLGEAVARAKAATKSDDVRRTWIFFGDPATRLKLSPR